MLINYKISSNGCLKWQGLACPRVPIKGLQRACILYNYAVSSIGILIGALLTILGGIVTTLLVF